MKERRAEVEARKKGVELFEYDEQGFPIRPRWELVASHTARRSCITNMYLSHKFTVKNLREDGIIRRVGPDKGGHWEVVNDTHKQ